MIEFVIYFILFFFASFRGNLLRDKGNSEAAVSSYKNAIKYRPSLAGNAFFVYIKYLRGNGHIRQSGNVIQFCSLLNIKKSPIFSRLSKKKATFIKKHKKVT